MMDAEQRRDFEERLTFLEDDREQADGRITALELQIFRLTRQVQEQHSLLQRLLEAKDLPTPTGFSGPGAGQPMPSPTTPLQTHPEDD